MKFTPIIVGLSLLLTACSRQDAKFTKQITGTWIDSKRGTIVYSPDGSFTITKGTSTNVYWFTGLWQIQNGILTDTITNASNTNWPWMGQTLRYHIQRLDDHRFEIEEASPIVKYTR
jgi:hypothetical protein